MPCRTTSRPLSRMKNVCQNFNRLKNYLNRGVMAGRNRIALNTGLIHWRYPDAGMSMVSSDYLVNFILSFPCLLWKNIQNKNITATLKQKVLFLYVKRAFPAQNIEIKLILNYSAVYVWLHHWKKLSVFSFPFICQRELLRITIQAQHKVCFWMKHTL